MGSVSALILIAEVIAAKPGVVIPIDEPELHLHRLIVIPLIATLIKSRPDCEFAISTHELDLPTSIAKSRVCIVRSVSWKSDGELDHWDFDIVGRTDDLPEGLVTDVLGSRRRVLFTEGAATSLDVPMYSVLFPKVSIRPKGSCKDVQHAVAGIKSTASLHRTEPFGLIDNDGMSGQAIIDFQAESIYTLPFFSVESLYYDSDVLAAVAKRQATTHEADEGKLADMIVACLLAILLLRGLLQRPNMGPQSIWPGGAPSGKSATHSWSRCQSGKNSSRQPHRSSRLVDNPPIRQNSRASKQC